MSVIVAIVIEVDMFAHFVGGIPVKPDEFL